MRIGGVIGRSPRASRVQVRISGGGGRGRRGLEVAEEGVWVSSGGSRPGQGGDAGLDWCRQPSLKVMIGGSVHN